MHSLPGDKSYNIKTVTKDFNNFCDCSFFIGKKWVDYNETLTYN